MEEEERDRERERVEEEERTNGKRRGKRKGDEERIRRRNRGRESEEKREQLLQVAESTWGLYMTRVSQYCKALRSPSEPLSCCHNGKVSLPSTW